MGQAIIGLVGVLVGAFLTVFKEWWFKKSDRQRSREYLAIRVVCILDQLLDECMDVVSDDGLWYGQRDPDGHLAPQVDTPELNFDALAVDWESLPADLAYEILGLPGLIKVADRYISGASEHAFPPDYEEAFEERQFQYAQLGLKVSGLSQRLRRLGTLPDREVHDRNPVEEMRSRLAQIMAARESRWSENRSMMSNV